MDGYADIQMLIIKRVQADRRAEGAANRIVGEWRRGRERPRPPAGPGDRVRTEVARLLVTIVLVLLGLVGTAGVGTLLGVGAGTVPDDGPTPGIGA